MKKINSTAIVLMLAVGLSDVAMAQKVWECKKLWLDSFEVLVRAGEPDEKSSAFVLAAGQKNPASFRIKGFTKRWDFGLNNGAYDYAFVIDVEGQGEYYDFSDVGTDVRKTASMSFICKAKSVTGY